MFYRIFIVINMWCSFFGPPCISGRVSGQQLSSLMTFDLNIWYSGSPWHYLGQVQSYGTKKFKFTAG